jgi:hypothetical protein
MFFRRLNGKSRFRCYCELILVRPEIAAHRVDKTDDVGAGAA